MEQQTQWTRPGYRPNYNGGTPPPQMGTMTRPFAQTVTPELSRAERLEAQRLAEQSRFDPNAYQVVRREFIAKRFCPSMTIRNKSIGILVKAHQFFRAFDNPQGIFTIDHPVLCKDIDSFKLFT